MTSATQTANKGLLARKIVRIQAWCGAPARRRDLPVIGWELTTRPANTVVRLPNGAGIRFLLEWIGAPPPSQTPRVFASALHSRSDRLPEYLRSDALDGLPSVEAYHGIRLSEKETYHRGWPIGSDGRGFRSNWRPTGQNQSAGNRLKGMRKTRCRNICLALVPVAPVWLTFWACSWQSSEAHSIFARRHKGAGSIIPPNMAAVLAFVQPPAIKTTDTEWAMAF
jgi:hypothetical protein